VNVTKPCQPDFSNNVIKAFSMHPKDYINSILVDNVPDCISDSAKELDLSFTGLMEI
jgi:hypothetical protein